MINTRIESIMSNKLFLSRLSEIKESEKDRKFCGHDISHFTDVSRIAYILNLENGLNLSKDVVYAAGLLHDIGRGYDNHNENSAELADIILKEASFCQSEIDMIKDAILHHRHSDTGDKNDLGDILSRADRLSRKCFECEVRDDCYWNESDKNLYIKY